MSWDKDPSLYRFFIRRGTRIFSALIICILLSVIILGPLLTTLSVKDYFSQPATLIYIKNIFLHISYYLPGVFEHSPYQIQLMVLYGHCQLNLLCIF